MPRAETGLPEGSGIKAHFNRLHMANGHDALMTIQWTFLFSGKLF